ncbi:hypothetical protein BH10ACT7_BH10ACT7_04320 [soil metagenome]
MHGCNASVSRSAWAKIGGFDQVFDGRWGYEDTEFAYRLSRAGTVFIAEPRALGIHLEDACQTHARSEEEAINFEIACERIPGFRDFKAAINANGREPWW